VTARCRVLAQRCQCRRSANNRRPIRPVVRDPAKPPRGDELYSAPLRSHWLDSRTGSVGAQSWHHWRRSSAGTWTGAVWTTQRWTGDWQWHGFSCSWKDWVRAAGVHRGLALPVW